tara:strand:- start:4064 stop:4300 length:237 start_codon:yes stop_codon:yes gene_type:complete
MLFSEWITSRGLTRRDAAALLRTTPSTITNWVHGTHRPGAAMTARIYAISGGRVTVADLHQAYQEARQYERTKQGARL